jgi:hypothetical protein
MCVYVEWFSEQTAIISLHCPKLIEPKHVALNDSVCIIKLSCADCGLVYHLKLLLAQRDGTRQINWLVFRRFHKFAKSDYYLRRVYPSVRLHETTRLRLDIFS